MNENVVFLEDIPKLAREDLEELCKGVDLQHNGTMIDLSSRIWEHRKSISILQDTKEKIFAGKRAITWFKFTSNDLGISYKELLTQTLGFDVFHSIRHVKEESLSATPQIMAATETDAGKYYIRCAYKSGIDKSISGNNIHEVPRISILTVYIEEGQNFIEIRTGDRKLAERTATMLTCLFKGVPLSESRMSLPNSSDLGKMADMLDGVLMDAKSKINVTLDTFGEDEKKAVINVIQAITLYFEEDNIENLLSVLDEAKSYITDPFVLMLINGLDTVGLGSNNEVRETLLFDWIKPYMEHQDGFIRFKNNENGVEKEYTIRIGVKKNTIYFNTPATEAAIKFVRDKLFLT